jgi:hypothetical protein
MMSCQAVSFGFLLEVRMRWRWTDMVSRASKCQQLLKRFSTFPSPRLPRQSLWTVCPHTKKFSPIKEVASCYPATTLPSTPSTKQILIDTVGYSFPSVNSKQGHRSSLPCTRRTHHTPCPHPIQHSPTACTYLPKPYVNTGNPLTED